MEILPLLSSRDPNSLLSGAIKDDSSHALERQFPAYWCFAEAPCSLGPSELATTPAHDTFSLNLVGCFRCGEIVYGSFVGYCYTCNRISGWKPAED